MESAKSESTEFRKTPQGPALYLDSEGRRLVTSTEDPRNQPKMRRLHNPLFTVIFFLLLLTAGAVCASTQYIHLRNISPSIHPPTQEEVKQFQELLNTIDPASLHKVLHEHLKDRYQHGVYVEDKTAIQIVHKENSEVAHGLIELAKRQGGVGSNSTSTPPPSSTSVSQGSTPTLPSSTAESSPTATSNRGPPAMSTTPALPPTTTPPSTSQPHIDHSTPTSGAEPTSKPQVSPKGPTSTPNASPSSITHQIVYKTTLADGVQTIVTATTVVPAPVQPGDGSGSKTNTVSASLQTNAAVKLGQAANVAAPLLGAVAIVVVVL